MSLNHRIRKKIRSHKNSDWFMYRHYRANDYITIQWVKDQLTQSSNCRLCSVKLKLVDWSPDDPLQFSIDRLNNKIAHIKSNCQITCLHCNRKKQ